MNQVQQLRVITNELKPDATSIYLFARAIDDEIKKFYEDPKNMAAFEAWKAKREAATNNINGGSLQIKSTIAEDG